MFAIKAMTIEGTLTGTLAEARDLLALAREGKLTPIPTRDRPLNEAQAALDDLRAGRVVGRTVLSSPCDATPPVSASASSSQLLLQPAHEIRQSDLAFALEPLGGEDGAHFGEGQRLCRC